MQKKDSMTEKIKKTRIDNQKSTRRKENFDQRTSNNSTHKAK